jgi:hypothetical protein
LFKKHICGWLARNASSGLACGQGERLVYGVWCFFQWILDIFVRGDPLRLDGLLPQGAPGCLHLQPESWLAWRSKQYLKALRASVPPDRWPAAEVKDADGAVRFVLNDGTEIHRLPPPELVYDIETGEPCGRIGHRGEILLLAPTAVEVEVAPPGNADDVVILDYHAEAGQPKYEDDTEIIASVADLRSQGLSWSQVCQRLAFSRGTAQRAFPGVALLPSPPSTASPIEIRAPKSCTGHKGTGIESR